MYLFFRLTSGLGTRRLEDPSPALQAAGFERAQQRLARCGTDQSGTLAPFCLTIFPTFGDPG